MSSTPVLGRSRILPMRIGVIGPGVLAPGAAEERLAEQVGELLGRHGAIVVCGGTGGVMAAACRGARRFGATTLGLLPGSDDAAANPYLTAALPTGLGELRNGAIVHASQAVVCVGGSPGTLIEVAFAPKTGTPCVAVRGWRIDDGGSGQAGHLHHVDTAQEAVAFAMAAVDPSRGPARP